VALKDRRHWIPAFAGMTNFLVLMFKGIFNLRPLHETLFVISECHAYDMGRRSSGLKRCKVAGFPTQAFGNDDVF